MYILTLSIMTLLQAWFMPSPAPPTENCTTTFVVTSCSGKPVPGARIQLITGYQGKFQIKRARTEKSSSKNACSTTVFTANPNSTSPPATPHTYIKSSPTATSSVSRSRNGLKK
ncbi:MAG: hypothetical protein IPJ40_15060 [Saprospirales bacterium]|nr:hypothetical protein [Saprospirales bacterium]